MHKSATRLALFAAALLVAVPAAHAQDAQQKAPTYPLIFGFESIEEDTTFFFTYGSTPDDETDRPYINFQELLAGNPFGIEPVQGDGALLVDWQLFSDQSWGGSMGIIHQLPDTTERFYDFSDFTHIHLGYNVVTPADPAATFRLKLHDASLGLGTAPSSATEDWYSENATVYQDTPGWKEFVMPLEDLGLPGQSIPAGGFSRPGCDAAGDATQQSGCWSGLLGNQQLDLDKISAITMEITGPQFGAQYDSTTAGTIVFDNLYVSGVRYELLTGFETAPGGWDNGTGSSERAVTTDDYVEGDGALAFTYNVVGSESWGGSADVQIQPASGFPNLTSRTHLSVFYKVVEPVDDPDARLLFKLFDNSTGTNEEWQYTASGVLDDTTGAWRRLLIPLNGNDLFLPSWVPQGDATFNPDAIADLQFQVLVNSGESANGAILFDRFTTYGSRQTDFEGPAAVEGFDVTTSEDVNIVSWTDVPGEDGERYSVYYSLFPITDLEAEGVLSLAEGVTEGTEVLMHPLVAPVEDQQVTYYYAIIAEDAVGNAGTVATTDGITNLATGIPTIHMGAPAGFAADGELGEWSSITPFSLSPEGELGHVAAGFAITDAQDLSADVYVAVDQEALYLAFDVTDDTYVPVPDGADSRWLYDGAEFYIGLYDEQRPRHDTQMSSGDEPDYKFYLYQQLAFRDGLESVVEAGDGNYIVTETADGWVIEARLPFESFFYDGAPAFTPANGMRIPLDLVIMDNDTPNTDVRSGILAFSDDNDDTSWQSPKYWGYSWIGDRITTVDAEDGVTDLPREYALAQNYPNPFNPSTIIAYELPQAGRVTLKVFNLLGQEVATVVDGTQPAGQHEVRFDAAGLASGFYVYQLRSGDFTESRKMMLVR